MVVFRVKVNYDTIIYRKQDTARAVRTADGCIFTCARILSLLRLIPPKSCAPFSPM